MFAIQSDFKYYTNALEVSQQQLVAFNFIAFRDIWSEN